MVAAPIISYIIERIHGKYQSMPRWIPVVAIVLNMIYILVFPVMYVQIYAVNPFASWFYLMFACIWFFKFVSYHHIWHDVRYHVRILFDIYLGNQS